MENKKVVMNDDMMDKVTGGTILPYMVKPGDTLEAIAKKYNVTVEQLVKWNHLDDGTTIFRVGQTLKVKF